MTSTPKVTKLFNVTPFDIFKRDHLEWRIAKPYSVPELIAAVIMAHTYAVLSDDSEQQKLALKFANDYERLAKRLEYSEKH